MDALISRVQEHRSVKPKALQTFVKYIDALCCVSLKFGVFVKGMAINCKRCLAGHAEIVHTLRPTADSRFIEPEVEKGITTLELSPSSKSICTLRKNKGKFSSSLILVFIN